jgi:glycosyltransferase involved in cell wall biosynthesis
MFTVRDHVMTHAAHIRATKVDMLDPQRAKVTRRLLFWNRDKLEVTSNTFVDPAIYAGALPNEKENRIVFLGRFVPVKQVEEFVECIPTLYAACRDAGIMDVKFYLLGHGPLESKLRAVLNEERFRDIDVELRYESQPAAILAKAKIGVSLQKVTNYPSKSLAEMLASGCVPIATDVGTTRMIAQSSFSYYVPEIFSAEELAARVVEILTLSGEEFAAPSEAAAAFARTELSVGKMADYYVGLYNDLAKGN